MQTRSILLSLALTGLSMASPSEVPASETKAASPPVLPIAPTVVNPAPVHPVPVAPTDIHVTVPHHDAIPHHQAGVGPVPAGVPSLNDVLSGGYDPESIGDIRQGDASSKINLPGSV